MFISFLNENVHFYSRRRFENENLDRGKRKGVHEDDIGDETWMPTDEVSWGKTTFNLIRISITFGYV